MFKLEGLYTALITPFDSQGVLDEEALRHLLRLQIEAKVDGVVVLGTTAETPTLTKQESNRIIEIGREETFNKINFLVGTGTYSTQTTIEASLEAKKKGADALLIIAPYYNRPTQEGLFLHFKAISEAVQHPIIIYNNPSRCGQNISTETLVRLASLPYIAGVKDCCGSGSQLMELLEKCSSISSFPVLTGDDSWTFCAMALGARGLISVLSNLIPVEMKQLVNALKRENLAEARQLHTKLHPLMRNAFIESNPIPIKWAMRHFGLPAGECRLPLCPLSEASEKILLQTLQHLEQEWLSSSKGHKCSR